MPAFIAAVIALGLYGVVCYYAFVYVIGPAYPFVILGAGGLGVLLVAVVLTGVLLGFGGQEVPETTAPDLRKRLPGRKSNFEHDRAWPGYLFGQSRIDLGAALRRTVRAVAWMWVLTTESLVAAPVVLVFWPLLLLP